MQREILFRGKRKDNGEWAYGDLITKPVHHECVILENGCINHSVIPETVGQYAEWKDINGVRIFEGDIAHIEYGVGKVVFHAACFMIEWLDDKEANMELLSLLSSKFGRVREDLVVTGNIFDNADLLTSSNTTS